MNQKLCKKARHLARRLSIGMIERELLPNGVNNPKSTRAVYLQIKRYLRKGLSLQTIERTAYND